jgi:hypothetical protein
MKKSLAVFLGMALLVPSLAMAWPYPPASGISVTTNGHTYVTNITVQGVIDWLDDNALFSGAGYVTAVTLASTLSSTSTQTFGKCNVVVSPTNAVRDVESFYGFVVALTNNGTIAVTNVIPEYATLTNSIAATYNPQSWFSITTGRFTPLIAGYWRLNVEALGTTTCMVKIISWDTNQTARVEGSLTNQVVNGGGIFYADGTSTNYFYVTAQSNMFSRMIFSGNYLGN